MHCVFFSYRLFEAFLVSHIEETVLFANLLLLNSPLQNISGLLDWDGIDGGKTRNTEKN